LKRTNVKISVFGEVEGLNLVFSDIQVDSVAHVDGLAPAGVRMSNPGGKEMQGLVLLGVLLF